MLCMPRYNLMIFEKFLKLPEYQNEVDTRFSLISVIVR